MKNYSAPVLSERETINPKLEFPRGWEWCKTKMSSLGGEWILFFFSRMTNTCTCRAQHLPSCFQMMFWSEGETTQIQINCKESICAINIEIRKKLMSLTNNISVWWWLIFTQIKTGWIQTGDCEAAAAVEDSLVETRARHSDGRFPIYTVKREKIVIYYMPQHYYLLDTFVYS